VPNDNPAANLRQPPAPIPLHSIRTDSAIVLNINPTANPQLTLQPISVRPHSAAVPNNNPTAHLQLLPAPGLITPTEPERADVPDWQLLRGSFNYFAVDAPTAPAAVAQAEDDLTDEQKKLGRRLASGSDWLNHPPP
jgi:hypothetical protein